MAFNAYKITFNPFSITRKIDKASPVLFQMACSGAAFQSVGLVLLKAGAPSSSPLMKYTFKLVAIKTISSAYDAESPEETVTFEYGGLVMEYWPQKADGSLDPKLVDGWNRVRNLADQDATTVIK